MEKGLVRSSKVFAFSTLLSRLTGMARDMVISWAYGAGPMTDAFFVAFAIPNMLRRFLGEGALGAAVVPVYTGYLSKSPQEAKKAFSALLGAAILTLALVVAMGILFSPYVVRLQVFGWGKGEAFSLTTSLTRICFPYLFFVSLVALIMGVLNVHGHFFAPAISPCLLNLSLIGAALSFSPYFDPPIKALAWGVLFGGALQLSLQVPYLKVKGLLIRPTLELSHPAVKEVGRLLFPMLIGASVFQINQIVNRLLASFLPHGSISYLYYADRVFELPIGLFAVALGVAALPAFSRSAALGDLEGMSRQVSSSLRLSLFETLPFTVLLFFYNVPIVSLLFERGTFESQQTLQTAYALQAFSTSIWAYGGIQVLSRAFYALKDFKTPLKGALLASFVNLSLGLVLMWPLKHVGLALANSLSAMVNFFFLFFSLKKVVSFKERLSGKIVRIFLASLTFVPWLLCFGVYSPFKTGGLVGKATEVGLVLSGAGLIYLLASRLLCPEEFNALMSGLEVRNFLVRKGSR